MCVCVCVWVCVCVCVCVWVCNYLKYSVHRIHSSPLSSSKKWPAQCTQSASCPASSVESSAKRSARSVSETARVGSRQTLLFRHFWKTKNSIRRKPDGFGFSGLFDYRLMSCPNKLLYGKFVIFSAVSLWVFGCRFKLCTRLTPDARRIPAEVNGEILTEPNDGWSLVFTKARWFTVAVSVSSEARGKSCGLKMFL